MMNEEDKVREALVRQGVTYMLENEIVNNDVIINDLIMAGFTVSRFVQDVEIFIDEKKKDIKFVLYFGIFGIRLASRDKIYNKLEEFVASGLKNFTISLEMKRYRANKGKISDL